MMWSLSYLYHCQYLDTRYVQHGTIGPFIMIGAEPVPVSDLGT